MLALGVWGMLMTISLVCEQDDGGSEQEQEHSRDYVVSADELDELIHGGFYCRLNRSGRRYGSDRFLLLPVVCLLAEARFVGGVVGGGLGLLRLARPDFEERSHFLHLALDVLVDPLLDFPLLLPLAQGENVDRAVEARDEVVPDGNEIVLRLLGREFVAEVGCPHRAIEGVREHGFVAEVREVDPVLARKSYGDGSDAFRTGDHVHLQLRGLRDETAIGDLRFGGEELEDELEREGEAVEGDGVTPGGVLVTPDLAGLLREQVHDQVLRRQVRRGRVGFCDIEGLLQAVDLFVGLAQLVVQHLDALLQLFVFLEKLMFLLGDLIEQLAGYVDLGFRGGGGFAAVAVGAVGRLVFFFERFVLETHGTLLRSGFRIGKLSESFPAGWS